MKLSTAKALGFYHHKFEDFRKLLFGLALGGNPPESAFLPEDVWVECLTTLECSVTNLAIRGIIATIVVFENAPDIECLLYQVRYHITEIHFIKCDSK